MVDSTNPYTHNGDGAEPDPWPQDYQQAWGSPDAYPNPDDETEPPAIRANPLFVALRDEAEHRVRRYAELIALLAGVFPSRLVRPNLPGYGMVYVYLPTGQVSFLINWTRDAELFDHVPSAELDSNAMWDGHTTDERTARIHYAAPYATHLIGAVEAAVRFRMAAWRNGNAPPLDDHDRAMFHALAVWAGADIADHDLWQAGVLPDDAHRAACHHTHDDAPALTTGRASHRRTRDRHTHRPGTRHRLQRRHPD